MFMSRLSKTVRMNRDHPVADTKYGKIRGIEKEGGYIFRGIKYADARRFEMPEEVRPWEGLRDAVTYGCSCPELLTPVPGDQQLCPHYYMPQDENCQYLNIWTQNLGPGARRPVMVWFHGGGWYGGSAVEQYAYDGENLSKFGDAVVVSVNHRLNVLGYLDLSAYGEEYVDSNRAGLADLVAALRWVRDNISSFGGDAGNVTIFGQSGGGGKVLSLMQTPDADGLFHKAIVQSGGAKFFGDNGQPVEEMARRLAEHVVRSTGADRDGIKKLAELPYWHLAEAVLPAMDRVEEEFGSRYRWEPLPDMNYFYGNPHLFGFRKENLEIPLIMGGTFGEGSSNSRKLIGDGDKNSWDEDTVMNYISDAYGTKGEQIAREFSRTYPDKKTADVLYIDRFDRYRMIELLQKRAAAGGKCWNYLFNLESPINSGTVAWHCSDIPFFFHNTDYFEAAFIPGISGPLQDRMSGAWLSFAERGNPNTEGLPEWPAVGRGKIPTMLFDRKTEMKTNHDAELLALLPRVSDYN